VLNGGGRCERYDVAFQRKVRLCLVSEKFLGNMLPQMFRVMLEGVFRY
jgi:hypothetical protein